MRRRSPELRQATRRAAYASRAASTSAPITGLVASASGCHWTPSAKRASGSLDRLDRLGQLVERRARADARPFAEPVDALVVVRLRRRARPPAAARGASDPSSSSTSWSAPSNVPGTRRCSSWPRRSGRSWISVPPQRDVHQLHAAADAEQRHVALDRRRAQRDLEVVALGHGVHASRRARACAVAAPGRCRRRRRAAGRRAGRAPRRVLDERGSGGSISAMPPARWTAST